MVEWLSVPVEGGNLAVARWPGDGPVVLAAHGITSNALAWAPVADALGGAVTLLAPDLRGRAGSRDLPAPYGMTAHARDLVAVLDAAGVDRAVVAGHSMGGFVACTAAARFADRVSAVVLVDGGLGFPVPEQTDVDAALHAVIGPAMQRLSMTFPSRAAYLDFWRPHPAFAGGWTPYVEAYLDRDLVGEPPLLRSSCVLAAVRTDGGDLLLDETVITAVRDLPCPAVLLYAERGMLDEPQALYDPARIAASGVDQQRVAPDLVPGTNHYTILLSEQGAAAVADQIRRAARV